MMRKFLAYSLILFTSGAAVRPVAACIFNVQAHIAGVQGEPLHLAIVLADPQTGPPVAHNQPARHKHTVRNIVIILVGVTVMYIILEAAAK